MKDIQPSVNDARLQAILDESRTREKQVSDTNKSIEALWHKLGELSDALHQFSCWCGVLARELQRQPSHDECCDRFELLVSELKTVVSRHGYEDFYQMIADSTAPNPEHQAACVILHQLLTSSNDESRTIINEIFGQDVPVCRYVFTALVPMLYGRWYTDYANIRRLPEIATLDHLGFLGDMRAKGFSLLMRARPDFAEFREQLRNFRPPTEFNPDEIQRFIDELRADDSDLSQSLLNTQLQELAQLFAAGRKRDQERARLDEAQLNVQSHSESANSVPAEPQREHYAAGQPGLKPVPAKPAGAGVAASQSTVEGSASVKPDGTEGGCWLRWKGKRHDIPKGVCYRFIEYMWSRDSASYDSLTEQVFEIEPAPQTIRSRISQINKRLGRIGVDWVLTADSVSRNVTKHQRDSK